MTNPRTPHRRAVIDVGTNSVKLLVADVSFDSVEPVCEFASQTRLGSQLYSGMTLSKAAITRTAKAVAAFASKARELDAGEVRIIATSAAREASNADALAAAIRNSTGLELTILEGHTEAALAFYGVATDPRSQGKPLMVIDVGGGSTQVTAGYATTVLFTKSLQLGAVRLLETLNPTDPPAQADLERCRSMIHSVLSTGCKEELSKALAGLPANPESFASGGTASVLAAMHLRLTSFDRHQIESVEFPPTDLTQWVERLWKLPIKDRRLIPGLPPERADVIITGVAILAGAADVFGINKLRVSTRGLRFGALVR
jgi:exopolyphosphatase/guanosine-5'-triphosphate,3'-diphosphate pyrophosphatase